MQSGKRRISDCSWPNSGGRMAIATPMAMSTATIVTEVGRPGARHAKPLQAHDDRIEEISDDDARPRSGSRTSVQQPTASSRKTAAIATQKRQRAGGAGNGHRSAPAAAISATCNRHLSGYPCRAPGRPRPACAAARRWYRNIPAGARRDRTSRLTHDHASSRAGTPPSRWRTLHPGRRGARIGT